MPWIDKGAPIEHRLIVIPVLPVLPPSLHALPAGGQTIEEGHVVMNSGLRRNVCFLIVGAAFAVMAMPSLAQQQGQYKNSGVLSCRMAPTIGLIVGSRQTMSCQFKSDSGGQFDSYSGVMTRVGLDLGITAGGGLAWAVLTSAAVPPVGGLAGVYVGASGDIAVGVGAGANVLIGGSNKSVALQPVSVEGQVGVSLALGVANLELRPSR